MRRKRSKKTRGINAQEKKFMQVVANVGCIECGFEHVVLDHMYGATFKHNKILIGMWAILPLCDECDRVKTFGSHKAYQAHFGHTQAQAFTKLLTRISKEDHPPLEVINAIEEWGR